MSVTIIRKQSGQANEVTDAMLMAIHDASLTMLKYPLMKKDTSISLMREAMEAARIAEGGEIEGIEIEQNGIPMFPNLVLMPDCAFGFIHVADDNEVAVTNILTDNLIPLAEALLELGKQMKGAV